MEKPDVFPGPNGRPMHVATAIVKRDKRAPSLRWERPVGRMRPITDLIVRCGAAQFEGGCRGVLGYPTSRRLAREAVRARRRNWKPGEPKSIWTLIHPDRYRGRHETGYFVLDPQKGRRSVNGQKIGARFTPRALRMPDEGATDGDGPRVIVGQLPEPPCIVFCPMCGRPNWIEAPDFDPPA